MNTTNDIQVPGVGGTMLPVPVALLEAAVASSSEATRVDMLTLACSSPRASSLPTVLELRLVTRALSHGAAGCVAALWSAWLLWLYIWLPCGVPGCVALHLLTL